MERIRCLILDVDGTLTDGRLYVDPETGAEARAFHVHDGFAIRLFIEAGNEVVICSGKRGGSIAHRAELLGIRHIIQASEDKVADAERVLAELGVTFEQTAMMGDDLPDAGLLQRCAFAIAPANARDEIRGLCKLVTSRCGGEGAVREAIEFLMRESGQWEAALARHGLGA